MPNIKNHTITKSALKNTETAVKKQNTQEQVLIITKGNSTMPEQTGNMGIKMKTSPHDK